MITISSQTLILRRSAGLVLLGRWRTGAFAGRITGFIGPLLLGGDGSPLESAAEAAVRAVKENTGANLVPELIDCRALFEFEEEDPCGAAAQALGNRYYEYQCIYDFDKDIRAVEADRTSSWWQQTQTMSPVWYPLSGIPYDEMPEDDPIWYDRVLVGGERCRGRFVFKGRTMTSHVVWRIPPHDDLTSLTTNVPNET